MNKRLYGSLALVAGVLLSGCHKSPFERTKNGSGAGGTGIISGSSNYVIFSSELLSGGGAFLYPGAEGQSLSFVDRSNPISERSIRYSWTGELVNGQIFFAGFDLMHTPVQDDYTATSGRDLRAAGYTRVSFYARASFSSNTLAKIEVADDGNSGTANLSCLSVSANGTLDDGVNPGSSACGRTGRLTSEWEKIVVPIVNPTTALASVKDFFKVTFIYNDPFGLGLAPGQGGTIFIDQIQYEP